MENSIYLYRGFVAKSLKEVAKYGFSISNPKGQGGGESNWPGGLSLGRSEGFEIATRLAREHHGIPIDGRIKIRERDLSNLYLLGIKRILHYEDGMTPGSIDYWRCTTWDDVTRAWEFTLSPKDLIPNKLLKLEGAIATQSGAYQPFAEFKKGIEGGGFIERFFRG